MKIKLTLYALLVLTFASRTAYSQTFSGLYDCDSSFDWGWDVFTRSDGTYFLLTGAQKEYNALGFINVSHDGNTIVGKNRYPIGMDEYPGDPGQAQHLVHGGYLVPITLQTFNRSFGGMAKMDEAGDTVFLKTYTDTSAYFDAVSTCTEMPNGNYVLGGSREQNTPSNYPGQIICTDSNGNLKWRRTFKRDSSQWVSVNSVHSLGQNRILVGAMSTYPIYTPQGTLVHNIPWFLVLDTLGNILRDTAYSGNYGGGGTIHPDVNGGYIHVGSLDSMPNPDIEAVENFPAYIAHLDTNFQIEWILRLGYTPALGKTYWSVVRQLQDGNFMLAGDVYTDEYGWPMGWLAKVSSAGTLLWSRQYFLNNHNVNYVRDAKEKPDKGFIVVGASNNDTTPAWHQHQDAWLVSVDSNGCITPGCDNNVSVAQIQEAPAQLKVYPNPTNGDFNIETSDKGRFSLYTLLGQLVGKYTLYNPKTEIHIAQDMAQGIYIGRFEPDDGKPETRVRIIYTKD